MEEDEPEIRRLPLPPPRCRGIPIGDGNYTGCAYGDGSMAPFTGPRDCPVCEGLGFEREGEIATTLPHSSFGQPDCCGCLNGLIRGDLAYIQCNECSTVIRTVRVAELCETLDEMELSLELATAKCARGAVNLRSGFSQLLAFTCQQCGEVTKLSDDPDIDRILG